jgi:hypothetical protein
MKSAALMPTPPSSTPQARILVVDDSPTNLLLFETLLAPLNQQVVRAASGEEALRLLPELDCAVVLLDIHLPGLSGFEVARLLRAQEKPRRTPIIFVTGMSPDTTATSQGYALGAVDFLFRPFDPEVLRTKVEVFVELFLQRERLQRQAVLEKAETERARLLRLLVQAPAAVAITQGADFVFEFVNPLFEKVAGRPIPVGTPLREALPELHSQPEVMGRLQHVMRTGEPFVGLEFPMALDKRGNGTPEEVFFNLVYQPVRDERDRVTGLLTHAVEVTEQVHARRRAESAEQARRASEEGFRAMFENAAVGMAQADPLTGRFLRVNETFCELSGYSAQELGELSFSQLTHPEDRERDSEGFQRMLRGEATHASAEKRYIRKDGRVIRVQVACRVSRDARGEPLHTVAIIQDITARHAAEERLRFLLEASRTLAQGVTSTQEALDTVAQLTASTVATWCIIDVVHEDGTSRRVAVAHRHAAGQALLHETPSLLGGTRCTGPLLEVVHTGETLFVPTVTDTERQWLAQGPEHLELLRRLETHSVITVAVQARGKVLGVVTLGSAPPQRRFEEGDVAMAEEFARRAATAVDVARLLGETRRRAEQLRLLADASKTFAEAEGDLGQTVRAVVRCVSEAFGDACVLTLPEELSGSLEVVATHHPDAEARAFLEETLQGAYSRDKGLLSGVLDTGQPLLVPRVPQGGMFELASPPMRAFIERYGLHSLLLVPLRARGRILGILGVSRSRPEAPYTLEDQSLLQELGDRAGLVVSNARLFAEARAERRRAEEASRLKDEFLASVSHELRTPLTSMLGWTQILRAGLLPPDKTERALETVERSARAQAQLVEDLLDTSRIVMGKLKLERVPMELARVVRSAVDTVRPAAEARGIHLELQLEDEGSPFQGDPHRLQQVVWNLVSNAVKFTPEGGQVHVHARRGEASVLIEVRDTGQGIHPDFLPHVFERFRQAEGGSTRRHGGLGLGLSIVKHLVEMHGGTVQATSGGEGQGATFTVRLPVLAPRPELIAEPQRMRDVESFLALPGLKGLKVLLVDDEQMVREMVGTLLESREARVVSVGSAREALVALARELPDVLVSDIGMPVEDGYSLIRQVRSLPAESGGRVPALALTAHARVEDRTRALLAGFHMHLPKPVVQHELLACIATLAGRTLGS